MSSRSHFSPLRKDLLLQILQMPRRTELKGVANDFVHWFLSRNNDADGYWALGKLCFLCEQSDFTNLAFEIWPCAKPLLPTRLSDWQQKYSQRLSKFLVGHGLPATWLASSLLTLEFSPRNERVRAIGNSVAGWNFTTSITLVTDLGMTFNASGAGNCLPHNPDIERRSRRL